ncbi:hypothetical protein TNCV_2318161 [Trichonephila clavipes]|nr:hypothetical protein TNCV_2318161 [Trichonephila clavipes]
MMQDSEIEDFSDSDYEEVDIVNRGSDFSVYILLETVYSMLRDSRSKPIIDSVNVVWLCGMLNIPRGRVWLGCSRQNFIPRTSSHIIRTKAHLSGEETGGGGSKLIGIPSIWCRSKK